MKRMTAALLLLASPLAFSRTTDLPNNLKEIEAEIEKIKSYETQGVGGDIFKEQLQRLEAEKAKYKRLIRSEKRVSRRPEPQVREAELKDKKLPTALVRDIKQYEDETVPLEKRYQLILDELADLYDMNDRLRGIPEGQRTAETDELRKNNQGRISELKVLMLRYELKLRESEATELTEARKVGVRVGVMFDGYYQWDFQKPQRVGENGSEILYRNYNNRHNDFTVNLFEINVYKSFKNLDFYADLDFGEQPEQNENVGADAVTHHIGQAFLRYKRPDLNNLTFTAGKFYSHFGLEVPKNIENKTYSRPFYFTLVCPFWHEGISLTQSGFGPGFGYGLYVYDKTDDRVDNDSEKTYGAQLNFARANYSAVYNLITGSEHNDEGAQIDLNQVGNKKTMHELILTHNTTDNLTLVFDGVVGTQQGFDSATGSDSAWTALVGYADIKLDYNFYVNFRYENFKDLTPSKSVSTLFYNQPLDMGNQVGAPTVDAYTVTGRYTIGNASEVRLEYRFDAATKEIFANERGTFDKHQNTLTLGWLYSI